MRSHSANGTAVDEGAVSPPSKGFEGLPQENPGFGNALRGSFRLSGVHVWTLETKDCNSNSKGSYFYCSNGSSQFSINLNWKRSTSARVIRALNIEKRREGKRKVESKGGSWRKREEDGEGWREGERRERGRKVERDGERKRGGRERRERGERERRGKREGR